MGLRVSTAALGAHAQAQVRAELTRVPMPKRSKYGAVRCEYVSRQGFTLKCDSRAEAKFAAVLDQQIAAGLIKCWIPQVPFPLPGKARHRVDFMAVDCEGRARFIEIKGRDLALGKLKRRQVEQLFGVEINVVGAAA